jgi:hypothetical protein
MKNYKVDIYFKFLGIIIYHKTYKIISHAILNGFLELIDLEQNRILYPLNSIFKFKVDSFYNSLLENKNKEILNTKTGVTKTV